MTAILAGSLAICESALAINLTIGNPNPEDFLSGNDYGQSFRNDPAGSGATILLNDWTFGFNTTNDANNALGNTLSIYSGIGKNGTAIASASAPNTALVTFGGVDSVKWTFVGGVSLIDNLDYTVVIEGSSSALLVSFSDDYANGDLTSGASSTGVIDAVFEGNFSATTPVPFEFEASGGLAMLGGAWLLRKRFQKKTDKSQT
ncbi:MAG: hypothetical protein AUK48_14865 [Oscillatoriales cyanobacterium CG2_30_44_21]|nr:MAG: hypothetical protein AUK48_14865 [Oscillatoriales cyanobacterium CG2_30_44_21]